MRNIYGAESRDGVNVKCEVWRRVVDLPVRQSQRCAAAPARPLPRQRAAALWAGMTKNSRAIFYLRTPAPSDDHAVLWYLPTCPEMRGLRTPPQTLLTLPRRSFFSPISPIPLTPPARPRSRASLAQSFFTCVWTTATLKERTCARAPFTIHLSMSQCPFGMMVRPPVSPPQNSMRSLSF